MKKRLNYIFTFLIFSILISCGKEDISSTVEPIEKKDVSFLFQVGEVTNKNVLENKKTSKVAYQKEMDDAVTVIVTIKDASNNILYNRKKLTISAIDNGYVSSPISLDFGTYTITEFIVLDALDNAIFLSPKEGSLLTSSVTNALPFSLVVGSSSNNEINVEVLSSFNMNLEDFGYTDLDFATVGEFTFIIDQTDELTSIVMNVDTYTDQYEYIIDWGDENEDFYIPVSDLIHNYSEKGIYMVTIKGNVNALKSVVINNKGLVDIDLSKLESLERILLISSQLTSLDVSSNKSLEYLSLISSDNKLTSIDLSSNILLKELLLGNNKLGSINLSNNPQLKLLHLYHNELTVMDLSNNLQLENIDLSNNPQLVSLDIGLHTKLKKLKLNYMKQLNLDNMDMSIYPELENLGLSNDNLSSIDLTYNLKLRDLSLGQNELTNLDLSANKELIFLELTDNQLTNLDLSFNSKIEFMGISNNFIEFIDISNSPLLSSIFMTNNQINDIANMEAFYSQLLTNVKTNNIFNGQLYTLNNNYVVSQTLIDAANELINDFNWKILY
ncbi:hypothetical protein [Confluentibacter sediminis]|uniref:hypothetical protein n=1 Tax=Confluentibacter sediminis TaxID=2219045 RepID=UPI000DAB5A68|nr:hypothetical protein [Confluentibacter sediminis]